jgi:hypothetical protein
MISMSVPGIAKLIQQVLLNLIYFDILMTDLWLDDLIEKLNGKKGSQEILKDDPLNSYFAENGLSSKFLVKNMGSTMVYLLIYLVAWIAFFFLWLAGVLFGW